MALQERAMDHRNPSPEELSEFAITFLLSGQGDARRLAVTLAERMPDCAPLELVFQLSLTAAAIEENFSGAAMTGLAQDAWRVAALLAVDLHMMALRKMTTQSCADLLHYWQTVDGYFLRDG
jgi:hypothetical protein